MKITSKVKLDTLKIYFEGILHISVYLEDLVAVNSWLESDTFSCIQFVFRNKAKMTVKYIDTGTWQKVLQIIDENI